MDAHPPQDTLAHVRAHWDAIRPNSPLYGIFFADLRIVAAAAATAAGGPDGRARVLARLPVAPVHINSKRILHGAVSAALVDWAGGMAIAAATGRPATGVSVDIHVSYVSAARAGDELEIEAWVQRTGRALAFTTVEIRVRGDGGDGDDTLPTRGPVVASGSHTKYVKVAAPDPAAARSA